MKRSLSDLYRLAAYYASHPEATAQEGAEACAFESGGSNHYYNCVHLHDPKGEYPYVPLRQKMSDGQYDSLRTRFTADQQVSMIRAFEQGLTVSQVAKTLALHYHPVTIFSLVYRTVCHAQVVHLAAWVPYSAIQYAAMAEQLREYVREHGTFPEAKQMQPELVQAIREMFATGKEDPLHPLFDGAPPTLPPPKHTLTEEMDEKYPPSMMDARLTHIESLLEQLLEECQPQQTGHEQFPTVETAFALDKAPPPHVERWLSKEALALFPKLIRGDYNTHSRDEDAPLFELEQAGLVTMPHIRSNDLMGGVMVRRDQLQVTDRGWALHRLIRDICEKAVFGCLTDLGAFMGFNVDLEEARND